MRELSLGTDIGIDPTLGPEEVARLTKAGTVVSMPRGDHVYHQGDPAGDVWFMSEGRAKAVLFDPEGQSTVLRLHLSGSLLGLSALGSDPVREADAVITETARLVRIPLRAFEDLMAAHPDLARRVTGLLVNRLRDFHHRLGSFAGLPVRNRVARTLLALARAESSATLRITHEELAGLTLARRPTVSAVLARLATEGCLRQEGRTVVVTDPDALAHAAAQVSSG